MIYLTLIVVAIILDNMFTNWCRLQEKINNYDKTRDFKNKTRDGGTPFQRKA